MPRLNLGRALHHRYGDVGPHAATARLAVQRPDKRLTAVLIKVDLVAHSQRGQTSLPHLRA